MKAAFFTVCGGGDDYEFLLGSIEHHATMGYHVVLDTTPPERAKKFRNLPDTVFWIHEPFYGSGWANFQLRTAAERARKIAKHVDAEVLIYMDSDDFYIPETKDTIFPLAKYYGVELNYVHWKPDGKPYTFGASEWHLRMWNRDANVTINLNLAWPVHPKYNGNPEHHPVPVSPPELQVVRAHGCWRHHVHYALGEKAKEQSTAVTTIMGWPDKGTLVQPVAWPTKLALWRDKGIKPSESFL